MSSAATSNAAEHGSNVARTAYSRRHRKPSKLAERIGLVTEHSQEKSRLSMYGIGRMHASLPAPELRQMPVQKLINEILPEVHTSVRCRATTRECPTLRE